MDYSKVWENEKYRIEINGNRVTVVEKETGLTLADTIRTGDTQHTMENMKKLIVLHELGNPVEKVVWENEKYRLEFAWGWDTLHLNSKSENHTLAKFSLDSPEVVGVIRKMVAVL